MRTIRTKCLAGCLSTLALAGSAHAQESAGPAPGGWQVVAPVTEIASSQGACANRSRSEWQVALDADGTTPLITPAQPRRTVEVRVPGGKLVGIDQGEFGGRLTWAPDNGPATEFYSNNIQAIAEMDGRYYAFGGLAHMGTNEGQMLRLDRDAEGRWRAVPVVALSAAPAAAARMGGDSILVVTSGALEIVHVDGARRVAHRNSMWSFVYPNSVAISRSGTVYVGMRSAVARLTPDGSGYREQWLVQAPCRETFHFPDR